MEVDEMFLSVLHHWFLWGAVSLRGEPHIGAEGGTGIGARVVYMNVMSNMSPNKLD